MAHIYRTSMLKQRSQRFIMLIGTNIKNHLCGPQISADCMTLDNITSFPVHIA